MQKAGFHPVYGLPAGLIMLWHGAIAAIADGFVACDGNNGSPNLLGRFVREVPGLGTDPGATGGADTHLHAGGSHAHGDGSFVVTNDCGTGYAMGGGCYGYLVSGAISVTGTSANGGVVDTAAGSTLPLHYDVAFIMKT